MRLSNAPADPKEKSEQTTYGKPEATGKKEAPHLGLAYWFH
jgi:hypothetical protein